MTVKAERGDHVQVQWTRLQRRRGGADVRRKSQTAEFTVGGQEVMRGLSQGVVGMETGESKRMTLRPQDAYGDVRRDLIQAVPRKRFPTTLELCVGKRLVAVGKRSGSRRHVTVKQMDSDQIVIDGNHRLAGRVMTVEMQLVALQPGAKASDREPNDLGGEA